MNIDTITEGTDTDTIDGVELIDGAVAGTLVEDWEMSYVPPTEEVEETETVEVEATAPAKAPSADSKNRHGAVPSPMVQARVRKPRVRKPKAEAAPVEAVKAPRMRKPRRTAAPVEAVKVPAAVVKSAKLAELPEGRVRTHERTGVHDGQNDFGRVRLSKAASTQSMWAALLANGVVEIPLATEVRHIRKTAHESVSPARLEAAARNRISQALTQPYQAWYANDRKGSGVFRTVVTGTKVADRILTISYVDDKRPPLLISPESGRPTMVGKVAAAMYEPGMRFKCGIKVADVKAVLAKLDDK